MSRRILKKEVHKIDTIELNFPEFPPPFFFFKLGKHCRILMDHLICSPWYMVIRELELFY